MNMLFRCASRLIAVGALTLAVPTFASASDATPSNSFKLAMGPTSAAQKNQGVAEKTDEAEIKPHHRIKPHRHRKHRRRHHTG
ncbi:hypothetical protein [Bradyrhizobium sp.]|jgi:hypothetical protein|uniref:hypothetical protein n=1 Tax=Bradyrhizobium sp. TaxID=376 RepID=UPI003C150694